MGNKRKEAGWPRKGKDSWCRQWSKLEIHQWLQFSEFGDFASVSFTCPFLFSHKQRGAAEIVLEICQAHK